MAKVINNKRKTSTPKPVDIKDDQTKENDEEETDEQLHLQNYKTDL